MPQPIKILLIEPNDESAAQCIALLTGQGWQVKRVQRFAEALELIENTSFDFAILDMILPDVVGTEAWAFLRGLCPGMLGILTTSSLSLHANVNPYGRGIVGYLLKPQQIQAISHLIAQMPRPPQSALPTQNRAAALGAA